MRACSLSDERSLGSAPSDEVVSCRRYVEILPDWNVGGHRVDARFQFFHLQGSILVITSVTIDG
jgi:hypothetical protein